MQALQEWLDSDEGEDTCAGYMDELLKASDIPAVGAEKAYRHILGRIKKHLFLKSLSRFRSALFKVASVLLLAGTAFAYRAYVENRETVRSDEMVFRVDKGNKVMLTLADGSKVWLNSESTLACSKDDVRQVTLEGEAYFEVQSDKEHPFYVNTPSGVRVFVTGTRFNVSSYENEGYVETVLESGHVNVLIPGYEEAESLQPGERLLYDKKASQFVKSEVDVFEKIAWKDGKLIFRDTPLPDMLKRLSRHFNIDIQFNNISGKEYKYRATFRNETLYQILDYLGKSVTMKWRMEEPVQQADGTFTKEKVIVDLY